MHDLRKRAAQTAVLLCLMILLLAQAVRLSPSLVISPQDKITEPSVSDAFSSVRRTQVQIYAATYYGAGTVIGETKGEILVLTCRHLAERMAYDLPMDGFARFFTGGTASAGWVSLVEQTDAAVVAFKKDKLSQTDLEAIRFAETDIAVYDTLQAGDTVFLVHSLSPAEREAAGIRDAVGDSAHTGIVGEPLAEVEGLTTPALYLYINAEPGMSGGGVFDLYGRLLGVLSAGNDAGEALCVPLSVILPEISKFL